MGARKKLITLHGVNPDPWQERVRPVFEPWFDCVALGYDAYNGMQGPLRVVCHPWALGFACASALGAAGLAWLAPWTWAAGAGVGAALLLLVCGLALAAWQRWTQARRTKADFSDAGASPGVRPHVIAHSFGTYLTAQALQYSDVAFDRVVFVGSPLARDFDWKAPCERGAVHGVRNEVGQVDRVAQLARAARYLGARDLGDAGQRGFVKSAHVHDTKDPWRSCGQCEITTSATALVHNVHYALDHSGAFLGPGHARMFWLPFLWGFEPAEFKRYLDLCGDTAYAHQQENEPDMQSLLDELAGCVFTWTGGDGLLDHLEQRLLLKASAAGLGELGGAPDAARQALESLCDYTARALQLGAPPEVRKLLYPGHAIAAAVAAVLNPRPTTGGIA